MQNASQSSFGFHKLGGERDPFQERKGQSPFSNSFGNYKSNDYVTTDNPFRSSSKSSGNGFYRNQRNQVAMDVSWSNEDARGRGRVSYHRGRGRTNFQENTSQKSGSWSKEAENEWMEVSWPFTCYGMERKPNTLDGDISFEELRAEAYAAALQGVGLNEIVQRERDLATEYRNRQKMVLSNTANPTSSTGTNPKDPFGKTESWNSHPFQTTNSFGSGWNDRGGTFVSSVPVSSHSGYSNMFQGLPQLHKNANSNSQTVTCEKLPTFTGQVKQPNLETSFPNNNPQETTNPISVVEQNESSQEDVQHYRASLFQLGNVPETAPSKEFI